MARKLGVYPELIINPENLDGFLNFNDIFGRCAPLHIEIGSGKGTFLVNQGQAEPNINFLGIEWARKFYRFAVDRLGRWQMQHIKMIRTDAADFITNHVTDESVQRYHIYYPDPWPKARHNKRRFFNLGNLDQLIRTLEPSGIIQLATDHDDYFEQMKNVLNQRIDVLQPTEFTRAAGAEDDEAVGTNYERKYIPENRNSHAIAVKKR